MSCDITTYNQSVVAHVNDVSEETAVDVFDDRTNADLTGVGVLGLAHPFRSDLRKRYIICNMCNHITTTLTLYLGLMKAS